MNALLNQVLVSLCVKNTAGVRCFLAFASSKQQERYHLTGNQVLKVLY